MFVVGAAVFVILFTAVDLASLGPSEDTECTIDIRQLSSRHALILKPTSPEFILPDCNGKLVFSQGQDVFLACPGRNNYLTQGTSQPERTIKCLEGTTFKSEGSDVDFKLFTCKDYPDAESQKTGGKCSGFTEIEIGFKVSSGFVRVFTTCFDEKNGDALFASYLVSGGIAYQQVKVPRPGGFEEGEFFPGLRPSSLYTKNEELRAFSRLLKSDELASRYIKVKDDLFFLSRGHMAAKGDFLYGSQQRATFFYVNVAPQWQIFNEKNWNSLEQDVRTFASSRKQDLEVYTGIYGQSHLPDLENHPTDLYLYVSPKNNQNKIKVPEIYWKLVYEPVSKTAATFIGHNNPYEEKQPSQRLCNDICDKLPIKLHWKSQNSTLGYGYCCEYKELKRIVEYLPDLEVKGVLL